MAAKSPATKTGDFSFAWRICQRDFIVRNVLKIYIYYIVCSPSHQNDDGVFPVRENPGKH